jgi:thiol-disulfide isomerase/thioredoxin
VDGGLAVSLSCQIRLKQVSEVLILGILSWLDGYPGIWLVESMRRVFAILLVCSAVLMSVPLAARPDRAGEYDFALEELETGQELTLELLTDGLPLVVHDWAPDCPHCKIHMPYVAALYKKLDLDAANFVSFAMTDDAGATSGFMADKQLTFPVMLKSSGELGDGFFKHGWPTTFVFAPGGEFVGWCDTNGPAYITEVLDLVEQAASGR